MPKYKIERQVIFSKKTEKQISAFLQEQDEPLNLAEILDQKGNTALHHCAYFDSYKLLQKYLAYMEKYSNKESILNPTQIMFEFVNQQNIDGLTPLHFAAFKGHIKMIQLLQKYGAKNFAKASTNGQNVLHFAAQNDKVETFIYFQSSIDINSKDKKQFTPLHLAAFMNSESVVTYLLAQKNIDMNCRDISNQTPLHFATAYGNTKIVKKLLRAGADPSLQNNKKETAMKIAEDNEFKNIVKLLSENKSLIDRIKLCMNLKTEYRPRKKSMNYPIVFMTLYLLFLAARFYFFEPGILTLLNGDQLPWFFFAELLGNLIMLLIYVSLLFPKKRLAPKTYMYYLNVQPSIPLKQVCLICINQKPQRSVHCDICRTCIPRYDHHCFWINNCVGQYNHNRFLSFILLFLFFLIYLVLIGISLLSDNNLRFVKLQDSFSIMVSYVFSVICFIFFGIFFIPMLLLVIVQVKNFFLNKTTYQRFTRDKVSSFNESNSHLISEEIKRNVKKRKKRSWSVHNAVKMMCSEETEASQRLNKSLAESLSQE